MFYYYLYWQYMVAPLWLLRFFLTLQQGLLQLFSVRVLVTTLFSHWHKDRVPYRQGTISGLLKAAAWNTISRVVGFCVRLIILIIWAVAESIFIIAAAGLWVAFIIAPLVTLVSLIWGALLLLGAW